MVIALQQWANARMGREVTYNFDAPMRPSNRVATRVALVTPS